jgi:hypothetical protein
MVLSSGVRFHMKALHYGLEFDSVSSRNAYRDVPAYEERPLMAEHHSHLSEYVEPRRLIQLYGLPRPITGIDSLYGDGVCFL